MEEIVIAVIIVGILLLALLGFISLCVLIYRMRKRALQNTLHGVPTVNDDASQNTAAPEAPDNSLASIVQAGMKVVSDAVLEDEAGASATDMEQRGAAPGINTPQEEHTMNKNKVLPEKPSRVLGANYSESLWVRALVVCAIVFGLTIPLFMVDDVVYERKYLQADALDSMLAGWGRAQHVIGPVVVIPYDVWNEEVVYEKDKEGREIAKTQRYRSSLYYKIVMPRVVDFQATINPVERYYGIYAATVYESSVDITGEFVLPGENAFSKDLANIYWHDAVFSLGMSGLKSLSSSSPLVWAGQQLESFEPNTQVGNLLGSGFHTSIGQGAGPGNKAFFSTTLNMRGAETLRFSPVGETSTINITGLWKDPSFSGVILPTSRTITDTDFTAFWSIPHLSRSYPQVFTLGEIGSGSEEEIRSFTVGVDLYEPVTLYRKVERSLKYGILFIGLTYAMLFSLELCRKERLHFLQYALVGVAMTVFYLSLLSLAEHMSFLFAFMIASGICIGMNSIYVCAATRSFRQGGIIGLALTVLYVCLYILLGLEKYALLAGTGLVLLLVIVLMFSTRNIGRSEPFRP